MFWKSKKNLDNLKKFIDNLKLFIIFFNKRSDLVLNMSHAEMSNEQHQLTVEAVILRRSTRKIWKTSRVPRSAFLIFLVQFFQRNYAGRGAQLSQPAGHILQKVEFFHRIIR